MVQLTTDLSDLPPELLQALSENIEPSDLLAWRLTCKQLWITSTRAFGRTHFTNRRHAFSSHDLGQLVEITKHAVWGPYVRTVEVSAQIIQRMGLVLLAERIAKREPGIHDDEIAMYSHILEDQTELLEGGKAAELLTRAFNNLRQHSQSKIELAIAQDMAYKGFSASAWKPHTQEEVDSIEPYLCLQDRSIFITRTMLVAASEARLEVANVFIHERGILLDSFVNTPKAAMSNLRGLKIQTVKRPLRPQTIASLAYLFSHAEKLEVFELHETMIPEASSSVLLNLMCHWNKQPLREMRIDGLFVTPEDLLKWLSCCKGTLRVLHIHHLLLESSDPTLSEGAWMNSWIEVLEWIMENLVLTTLHLDGAIPFSVKLDDQETVNARLKELLVSKSQAAQELVDTDDAEDAPTSTV